MSIRLCQACLHEIKEGDKLCSNCMVSVNRHATVIEVMSEYEGFSYVSNRYAFHDENLNNYNQEPLKNNKNSRLYPENINQNEIEEDFEYIEEEESDFVKNLVRMINNPNEYKDVLFGLLGSILLILGNFITIYSNIGVIRSDGNRYLNWVTIFIIAAAIFAMLLVLKHKKKFVLIPTINIAILLIFVLSDNDTFKYLSLGYCVMWMGVIFLVLCAVVNTRSKIKKYFLRKKDLTWVMLTFFLSLGLINTFTYFSVEAVQLKEEKTPQLPGIIFQNNEIKTIKVEDEKLKLDISLLDSFLVNYDDKDLVVVELSIYNQGKETVKVSDYFDIYVMHNDKKVVIEKDLEDLTYFDISTGDEKIKFDECKTMFLGFYIKDKGDCYLNIFNTNSNESIINHAIALNSKFYIQQNLDANIDGSIEDEEVEEKESYMIYFKKPSNWSDNICAYIYYMDDNSVVKLKKWPGKKMRKNGNMYELSYDKEWYGKGRVIIVDKENTKNMFPKEKSLGLKLEGNLNIMPKEE